VKFNMFQEYIEVIKPKQTFLLMVTFLASYLASSRLKTDIADLTVSTIAVLLCVAGATAINMWLDMDVDKKMNRTKKRPLPSGRLGVRECIVYGVTLYILGLLCSIMVRFELTAVLAAGFIFYIIVYTVFLKRRSAYSILIGGVAGGMPSLAGWVATSGFSLPGLLVSLIVLLWIPSHIWYISMHYEDDYRSAGIPTYPLVVGMRRASWAIVVTTGVILLLEVMIYLTTSLSIFYLVFSMAATLYFIFRAARFALKPSRAEARKMYKLASMTLGAIFTSIFADTLIKLLFAQ